jgi:hypothetical protein
MVDCPVTVAYGHGTFFLSCLTLYRYHDRLLFCSFTRVHACKSQAMRVDDVDHTRRSTSDPTELAPRPDKGGHRRTPRLDRGSPTLS